MLGIGELVVVVIGGGLLLFGGRFPALFSMVRQQLETKATERIREEFDKVLNDEEPDAEEDQSA